MKEWKQKRRTMRHYDQSANVYDAQYAEEQEAKIKAAMSTLQLGKNDVVLDAGCGTGLLFPHIAGMVKLVVGLDLSTRILQEAQKRMRQLPNTTILRADADQAPFPNQTFDKVFAITLLQNTPDPLLTLEEIKRLSRDQAVIVATGLKKQFTQESFTNLLHRAKLSIRVFETDKKLKGYVAVCSIQHSSSLFSAPPRLSMSNKNITADEALP